LSSFKQSLESQYRLHNYGDLKLYKSPTSYYSYPEVYQVLYNLEFKFNEVYNKFEITFDSLFFDKLLIENQDLNIYKNFSTFEESLFNWRDKGNIIEFKKSFSCLYFLGDKYILEDFFKEDLDSAFKKIVDQSKDFESINILFLIKNNDFNKLKLFSYLKKKDYLFFYFIPTKETKLKLHNILLINVKKINLCKTLITFSDCSYFIDQCEVFKYLSDEINWGHTDLFNHYL